MLSESQSRAVADRLFRLAAGKEAEATITSSDSVSARFGRNQVNQNDSRSVTRVDLKVYLGRRFGQASMTQTDDAALKQAVLAAEAAARLQEEDPALPPLAGGGADYGRVEAFFPATAAWPDEERARAVKGVIEAARARGFEAAGLYESCASSVAYATSAGAFAHHEESHADFSATVTTRDSQGWAECFAHDARRVDAGRVRDTALAKAVNSRAPRDMKPGRVTVILEPNALANLLRFVTFIAFNGLRHHEGRSPLSKRLGDKVFSEALTIADDCYGPETPGMPFDYEGSPRRRLTLVDQGVFRQFATDRRIARDFGGESTGHSLPQPNTYGAFPNHVQVAAGNASLEELIAGVKNGLLVTQFHYTNVQDPMTLTLTGMTRNGTWRIRDGAIAEPVKNLRFTQSMLEALARVSAVGKDRTVTSAFFGGRFLAPAVRIEEFQFTSATDF
ncbi:MAG: TldD/PmbA family protein [Planctomycetes bacterium]|nr:TldD/PmbA family protein [Planctomycetota bacterium]